MDRYVRTNKLNKNKNETTKIQTLISTLAYKNKHDELVCKSKNNNLWAQLFVLIVKNLFYIHYIIIYKMEV